MQRKSCLCKHEFARDSAHKADKTFKPYREVLRLRQGYSTSIRSDKGLRLALWRGKSVASRKKALYKSGSEATMRT